MNRPLLQLEGVYKKFSAQDEQKSVEALRDINFSVEEGEFLTILGPSGCGKTTLLRIITGLTTPTKGICRYKGEIVTGTSLERGYVFQEPRLFPWLTVLENIRLAGDNGLQLLEMMQLLEFKDAFPHELSGGMARRVALARALAAGPELLLLDEPLANIDQSLRKKLQGELRLIWQQGVTCILVTHDLDEALALGTRLILLSERPGQILEDLPINLLKRKHKQELLEWMEV